MTHFIGLDVSQKMPAICVIDNAGNRLWRGQCPTDSAGKDRSNRAPTCGG
jgi:transposase